MIVAERARTGAHRWENDWCPKCKERMTFWFVSETRTRCAMCATEKDKSRGLALGPPTEEPAAFVPATPEPAPAAPEPVPAEVPSPVVDAPTAAPPAEPVKPREPIWVLSWCSECRYNASFTHKRRETFACMSCGMSKELPGVAPPSQD
jgi:hypothetical protein